MNCKHVANLLSPLLEGELSEANSMQVRAHLDTCPVCAAEQEALLRAVSLLQKDAAMPQMPLSDLYPAFQERLVTQPNKSSLWGGRNHRLTRAWLLPRLAVCMVGTLCVANTIRHKFFPYNPQERALLSAASSLSQYSHENSIHVNEIRRFRDAKGDVGSLFFNTWWRKGYYYSRASRQKASSLGNGPASESIFSYGYGTPGGVTLQWEAEGRSNKPVRLAWSPSAPAQSANNPLQYQAYRYGPWCQQIAERGKTVLAQVQVQFGHNTLNNPFQYKVSLGDLKAGLRRSDGPDDSREAPDALTLWFDSEGRLQRALEQLRKSPDGLLYEDMFVDYPANPLPQLAEPDLPPGRPVVLAYKLPAKVATVPPECLIKPVWLTMTKQEKAEIEGVVWTFTTAWKQHDAALLRNTVDLDYPLEITRPDKRAGLTREDVWQRVWLKRMQSQPTWSSLVFNTDFAFESAPRQPDEVPLNVGEWNLDHSLPGLNVLAWMSAKLPDGQEYKTGARLYLVKRPTGWKVFQFGLLHNGVSSTP